MEFEIDYYRDNTGEKLVEKFLQDLEIVNYRLAKQAYIGIAKLKNRVYHKEPLSKHLEQGLWELRVKAGSDILRIIYTFAKGRLIILLHVFVKKKQKTPEGELEKARKRLKEVQVLYEES